MTDFAFLYVMHIFVVKGIFKVMSIPLALHGNVECSKDTIICSKH